MPKTMTKRKGAVAEARDVLKPMHRVPATAARNGQHEASAATPATVAVKPKERMQEIIAELQALQRKRTIVLKSSLMEMNRLRSLIAGTLGFDSNMAEKERKKIFKEADTLIKQIAKGQAELEFKDIVLAHLLSINAFEKMQDSLEKEMERLAGQLPVAAWARDIRGFGKTSLLFLAIVIGETGDLSNYSNPGKVWRRMGCAPWTYSGKTKMGCTWRWGKEGALPKDEWSSYGYSPRRRSIAYLIGENIVKQNFVSGKGAGESAGETDVVSAGPYRSRYDQAKARAKEAHPEWSAKRCHLHAMLLATKLLLKNLWIEWNGGKAM